VLGTGCEIGSRSGRIQQKLHFRTDYSAELDEFLAGAARLVYYWGLTGYEGRGMFHPLAKLIDLHDGYRQVHTLGGKGYLLLQDEGCVFLVENRCPHMDAPLANGDITGGVIRCKAHGIAFDLATGKAQGPLAGSLECLEQLELIYNGDRIGVEI
jgi:nitrite reductase/ring-hydroxylating ferredoxin subunit